MRRILEILSLGFSPELRFDRGAALVADGGCRRGGAPGSGEPGPPWAVLQPSLLPAATPTASCLGSRTSILALHTHPASVTAPPRTQAGWEGHTARAQGVRLLRGTESPGCVLLGWDSGGLAPVPVPPFAVWPR